MSEQYVPELSDIEITGEINFSVEYLIDGIKVHIEWTGGDIAAVSLEYLRESNFIVRLSGDYIYIGQYVAEFVGYKSPGLLVMKLVGVDNEDEMLK